MLPNNRGLTTPITMNVGSLLYCIIKVLLCYLMLNIVHTSAIVSLVFSSGWPAQAPHGRQHVSDHQLVVSLLQTAAELITVAVVSSLACGHVDLVQGVWLAVV